MFTKCSPKQSVFFFKHTCWNCCVRACAVKRPSSCASMASRGTKLPPKSGRWTSVVSRSLFVDSPELTLFFVVTKKDVQSSWVLKACEKSGLRDMSAQDSNFLYKSPLGQCYVGSSPHSSHPNRSTKSDIKGKYNSSYWSSKKSWTKNILVKQIG